MKIPPYQSIVNAITGPILEHIDKLPPELFFFLEDKSKNGIFMPHGMSDKGYHKPARLATIQRLLYSGPLWKEKLVSQGIPAERIHIVGCPRLDPVFQGKVKYIPGERKRVAWCPTHNAIPSISSYPVFGELINKLPEKYEVITSLHPARSSDPSRTSLDVIVNADVVLSDTSSLLLEALAIGKPVILLDWLVKDGVLKTLKGTLEERIYQENICYHAGSFAELPALIDLAIEKQIDVPTKNFIDGIFPLELRGDSGRATAEILCNIGEAQLIKRGTVHMFNDESFIGEFVEIVKKLEAKTALEAGFGSGELVTALREAGIDVIGIDKSKALLNVPDGPQFIVSKLEDFKPERGKKFDIVYSSGVLEHFENGGDVEFIKKMATLARSKKYILNFVPYSGCLAYKNRKAIAKADWKDEADYTPEELAAIHQKAGLQVIESGLAAAQWPRRFGPEPSEPYLVYCLAKKL